MKNRPIFLFVFLFVVFSVKQINAFGMIKFIKIMRVSADIRANMRSYYESNENVVSIIFIDDDMKDHVSTELILKNNITFVFRAYYENNELKISTINFFGDYSPCNVSYNLEKDECVFWKGDYLNFIGSNSVEFFINNAEECIKKIEALPEYTADKFYCSEGENAKEVFDSLPGEAIQLDEFRWEKYVKVKRARVQ